MKNMIIASTSTVHGTDYLTYLLPRLKVFFEKINTILFIPYARPGGISYDNYTYKAKEAFEKINKNIVGIHEFDTPVEAVKKAEAIFVGGGNTFELVSQLYKHNLITILKKVVESGVPYLGTSAGSNICGVNVKNTNDMPIVYPPSFDALNLVNFNINPHYLDPNPESTHMGETRETRIKEFHIYNQTPVVGLREGSWLHVQGSVITLEGNLSARVFLPKVIPYEISTGSELKFS